MACLARRWLSLAHHNSPVMKIATRGLHISSRVPAKFVARHELDGVPENQELIYENHFKRWVYTSYVSVALCAMPMTSQTVGQLIRFSGDLYPIITDPSDPLASMVLMSAFGISLLELLRRLVNTTVLRIYRESPGNYTLVGMNWIFSRYQTRFTPRDVLTRQGSPILKNMTGNYTICGQPVVLLPKDFSSMEFYNELCMEANTKDLD